MDVMEFKGKTKEDAITAASVAAACAVPTAPTGVITHPVAVFIRKAAVPPGAFAQAVALSIREVPAAAGAGGQRRGRQKCCGQRQRKSDDPCLFHEKPSFLAALPGAFT